MDAVPAVDSPRIDQISCHTCGQDRVRVMITHTHYPWVWWCNDCDPFYPTELPTIHRLRRRGFDPHDDTSPGWDDMIRIIEDG